MTKFVWFSIHDLTKFHYNLTTKNTEQTKSVIVEIYFW